MSSPCRDITVTCPACGETFQTWHRASLNLQLDHFDEKYIRSVNVKTCPHCIAEVHLSSLVVDAEGVFQQSEGGNHAKAEEWPPYNPETDDLAAMSGRSSGNWDCMWLRPNRNLLGFDQNLWYALTIDGYAYYHDVWHVSEEDVDRKVMSFRRRNGRWVGSFEDLRVCLFFFQRSIRWAEGSGRDTEGRRFYDAIYRAVCTAWDREFKDHREQVALAYRTMERMREENRKRES